MNEKDVVGMENRFLIVVDMQNDFVGGSLGSEAAQAITPAVLRKVAHFPGKVIFTQASAGAPPVPSCPPCAR